VVIASACNRGMAVIAQKDSPVASIKDLRGKRVAIWPGSTQEVFILERLRMEAVDQGHHAGPHLVQRDASRARARRRRRLCGAEPGPGVSLASGVGKLVEYPYGTAMGSLNMIFGRIATRSPRIPR